jgi:hypothetical protein
VYCGRPMREQAACVHKVLPRYGYLRPGQ